MSQQLIGLLSLTLTASFVTDYPSFLQDTSYHLIHLVQCLTPRVISPTSSSSWLVRQRRSAESVKAKGPSNGGEQSERKGVSMATHGAALKTMHRGPEEASDADHTVSEDEEERNPYPLEGKYVDEADRQRCACSAALSVVQVLNGSPACVRTLAPWVDSWRCLRLSGRSSSRSGKRRCSAYRTSATSTRC